MERQTFRSITLLFILPLLLPAFSLQAGEAKMRKFNWKRYSVSFTIPDTWKVTKNTAKVFIANGPGGVVMKIGPTKTRNETAEQVAQKALDSYKVIQEAKVLNRRELRGGDSGFKKFIIFGEGKYGLKKPASFVGKDLNFGIIGLVNIETVDALYVRFYWFKGRKDTKKNSKITFKVAQSFKALSGK